MIHQRSTPGVHRHRPSARRTAAVAAVSALLVAVGGGVVGAGTDTTAPAGGGEVGDVTFAWTSPTQPTFVNRDYGIVEEGPAFGLNATVDDMLTFDSHAVATQAVLSGDADVVGGSFVSNMLVNQQGEDFKAFCPFVKNDDFVLVSSPGIDAIGDIFADDVSVALDSPGGAGDIILNAMLQAAGEERTTADIPGIQILESSGLRTTAFAAGDVDVTLVHLTQYNSEILPAVPDAQIISRLYEDVPTFLKETFAAPSSWIDENLETAAAICAAVISGSRTLVARPRRLRRSRQHLRRRAPGSVPARRGVSADQRRLLADRHGHHRRGRDVHGRGGGGVRSARRGPGLRRHRRQPALRDGPRAARWRRPDGHARRPGPSRWEPLRPAPSRPDHTWLTR